MKYLKDELESIELPLDNIFDPEYPDWGIDERGFKLYVTEKNTKGNNFSNREFTIYNKSDTTKGLKIVNIEEIKFFDTNKVYDVSIEASLNDRDGSETLSVVIKNVPEEAKLYDSKGTEILSTNGEYKVKVPAGAKDISDSLTMKVPQSYNGEIDLQIEATSTEARDNSSSKTTGTEDSISFAGGGDIDLSNLKNKSIFYSISKIIVNYENQINVSVVDTNTLQIEDLNELDLLNVGDIVSIEGVINDNVYIIVEVESSVDSNKYISSTHMTTNFYTNILVGSNKYLDNKENYLLILKEITKLFNFNSLQLKKDCANINFLVSYKTNKNNVDNLNNQVDYILLTLTLRENKNY